MGRLVLPLMMAMSLAVVTAAPSFAAPGDLDSPFGAKGKVTEVDSNADDVLVQGNKIVVAADDQVNRYTTTGARDSTFGGGDGSVAAPTGECSARSIALQADGKLVTAGCAINAFGEVHLVVTRYTEKGLVDPTFGLGGFVTSDFLGGADAVAIQPDGKIVAAGSRVTPFCCPHVKELVVVRYRPDGKLDPSFSGDGVQSTLMPVGSTYGDFGSLAAATAMVIQPNGKITVVGIRHSQGSPNEDVVVVRYDTAGNLDPVWGGSGMVITDLGSMEQGTGIAQQPDGRIVVSGTKGHPGNYGDIVPEDMLVLRYNSDGSLDSGFGSGGSTTIDFGAAESANDLVLQADGKIVVVGKKTHENFALARLNGDGTPDAGFGSGGKVTTPFESAFHSGFAHAVALQSDGKLVVVGTLFRATSASSDDSYLAIARYLAAGASPPCNITGTSGNDVLLGTAEDDVICSGDGDDIIRAGLGNDRIFAGSGNDTVFGEGGSDTIFGGPGNDILNGENEPDTIHGDDGNDTISGGPHGDALYGDGGADGMRGGGGPDYFSGGAGADVIDAKDNAPDDTLDGGAAVDTCASDPGDTVTGCP